MIPHNMEILGNILDSITQQRHIHSPEMWVRFPNYEIEETETWKCSTILQSIPLIKMMSQTAFWFRKLQGSTIPQITTINKHNYIIPMRKLTKRKANGDQVKIADNDGIMSFVIRLEQIAPKWKVKTNKHERKHFQ